MTPKQKEALRLQLEKEQIIRLRLQSIQSEIFLIESIIKACICGNPKEFSIYYSSLITDLLRNLQSPLAASSFVKLYVNMGKGVFEDNHEKGCKFLNNSDYIILVFFIVLLKYFHRQQKHYQSWRFNCKSYYSPL